MSNDERHTSKASKSLLEEERAQAFLSAQTRDLEELQQLLDDTCVRAPMFVGDYSIVHLSTWIHGFISGRAQGTTRQLPHYLRLFGAWLSSRVGQSRSIDWAAALWNACNGDDREALRRAPILFREFRQECGNFSKKNWFEHFGPWMMPWKDEPPPTEWKYVPPTT